MVARCVGQRRMSAANPGDQALVCEVIDTHEVAELVPSIDVAVVATPVQSRRER